MSAENTEIQAAAWLAREDRGLAAEERDALDLWLDQSDHNRVAYLRLKGAWARTGRLAALKFPNAVPVPVRLWRRPAVLMALAAALIVAASGGAYFLATGHPEQVFTTDVGRLQQVRLADGTRVELNTSTRLRAAVTRAQRIVTLDSGEAYFDVVHDASRPFVVFAGNRRITDLGTKFSVYREGDDVRVLVREGRVRVDILDRAAQDTPVVADAGHAVVTKDGEALVLAKPDKAISDDLSWRSGMLIFNQQTLADAADQFNRYNTRKIMVLGNARKIRIGGSFKAGNVDVFVLLLHRGFGLTVNDQGQRIVVSR